MRGSTRRRGLRLKTVDRCIADRPVDLLDGEANGVSGRPGESSLSVVIGIQVIRSSEAEAATERSEGVAGAERHHLLTTSPQDEPSTRAERAVGEAGGCSGFRTIPGGKE